MNKKPSRQRVKQLQVPVLPSEAIEIKAQAARCGLPVAAYLRTLGLQHEPKTIMDANAILELSRINGDLGRLGGLLKMWLTNEGRFELVGREKGITTVNELLDNLIATQSLLFESAKKI